MKARDQQLNALVERVRALDENTIDSFVGSSVALMDSLQQLKGSANGAVAPPAGASSAAIATGDSMPRTKVGSLLAEGTTAIGRTVLLKGWVRTVRDLKNFSFVEVNDGSSLAGMQVVALANMPGYDVISTLSTGVACSVVGKVVESKGAGQAVELKAAEITLVGSCPADAYPLQKKRHSLEFLRTIAHLRPRTNLFGAISRVRSSLAQATHAFFASEGFKYVQTPLITASDCEGAGEMFRVTTLDPTAAAVSPDAAMVTEAEAGMSADELVALEEQISAQGDAVRAAKEAKKDGSGDKATVDAEVLKLLALKAQLPAESADAPAKNPNAAPSTDPFADDFFGKQAFLTVSGQLSAENYACALGDVYTFGPTFRAEQSYTARHLAEFWMIEPEMGARMPARARISYTSASPASRPHTHTRAAPLLRAPCPFTTRGRCLSHVQRLPI